MILLIDNYDSFVYNLARYFEELGCETNVVRNDAPTVAEIRDLRPQAIVLSPGPCSPSESGVCLAVVRELGGEFPILGVCLGHQVIAQALGGQIVRAAEPRHGRTSLIHHDQGPLYEDLPNPLTAARYHSLIVDEVSLPTELTVTARSEDGVIMALQHRHASMIGVQFHPESVLTSGGHLLLRNFLKISGISCPAATHDDFLKRHPPDDFYRRDVVRAHPYPGSSLAVSSEFLTS